MLENVNGERGKTMKRRRAANCLFTRKHTGQGLTAYVGAMVIGGALVTSIAVLGNQGMSNMYSGITGSLEGYFGAQSNRLAQSDPSIDVRYKKKRNVIFTP
jgi:hypothetical protein